MVLFTRLALVAASIAGVVAMPWDASAKYATHRVRKLSRDLYTETYHPENIYKTYGAGIESPLKKRGEVGSVEDQAVSFLTQELGLAATDFKIRTSATTDTGVHVWAHRIINDIPVANLVANVAFNPQENVVAFGANFNNAANARSQIASSNPAISKEKAISAAQSSLSGKHNGKEPSLQYYQTPSGALLLTYVVEVQTDDGNHWYEAFVDASNGSLVASNDFVAQASYLAVDPQVQDLTQGYNTYTDPADKVASPNGWHAIGSTTSTDTSGNNVVVYKGSTSATTKQSSTGNVFNYRYDATKAPTAGQNVDAARTNAFFISNHIHDINYRYGFTEATFNFQNDNLGKGGSGNDRIKISAQDGSGTDNANFATPADGTSGQMRMYIWTQSTPNRDGDMENDVIAHEQTHGTTNRMTGGGTGRCLQTTESGGMGEGWSDAFASWLEHKDSSVPDFAVGSWVYNKPAGLRTYPYSTSSKTNPLKYSDVKKLNEVHDIGEIWANLLHNVYAELVGQFGWSPTSRTDPTGQEGNVVWLHLFMDALLLQPCNPTMVQARDAWIQADTNRYKGAHICAVYKAFASRGLGTNASKYVDNFDVPASCSGGNTSQPPATSTTRSVPTTTSKTTRTTTTRTSTSTKRTRTTTTTSAAPTTKANDCPSWWPDCPWA